MLNGRFYAGVDDIRAVAFPVLRHRIMTNFNAEAEGIKPDDIIRRLLDAVPAEETPPMANFLPCSARRINNDSRHENQCLKPRAAPSVWTVISV